MVFLSLSLSLSLSSLLAAHHKTTHTAMGCSVSYAPVSGSSATLTALKAELVQNESISAASKKTSHRHPSHISNVRLPTHSFSLIFH
jgi:hypothetical protein